MSNDNDLFGDEVEWDWGEEETSPAQVPQQERGMDNTALRVQEESRKKRRSGLPNPNEVVENPRRRLERHSNESNNSSIRFEDTGRNENNTAIERTRSPRASRRGNENTHNNNRTSTRPREQKKKKSNLVLVFIIIFISAVIGVFIYGKFGNIKQEAQVYDYNTSGRYVFDQLRNSLVTFDAEGIDSCVGIESGDSYLAQEWAYVNGVSLREEFITKVCSLISFRYPQVPQKSTTGQDMLDSAGNTIMMESYMNDGESVFVTIPDYEKITATMDEDATYIKKLFKSSKYSTRDYTWNDEMVNLMLQYICDKDTLPTIEAELSLSLDRKPDGGIVIKDDTELDKALFSSDDFHKMCAKFSQVCLGWTGFKDEKYTEKEEQTNPEYDEWLKLFNQYYAEDEGKFNKNTSKWEPWFLRDENNNYILDENGEKIVNYYSVKDINGKDWIEPDKTIMVDVEKTRQVEDPWIEETAIPYNWIGTYYIQNEYKGNYDTTVRVGDGSKEAPAGIGTSIITKVLCTDGKYHDVKVSLKGYWTEEDAIEYAEKFSNKNRGFTNVSVIKLICYEVEILNLEKEDIEFVSEMTLCDGNSNISSRTGTMYGFTETVELSGGESVIINDWATSTELEQKYVCWGKSFGRDYSMIYFNILAGTGNIPPYSAYEYFTGKSSIDESVDIPVDEQVVNTAVSVTPENGVSE